MADSTYHNYLCYIVSNVIARLTMTLEYKDLYVDDCVLPFPIKFEYRQICF